MNQENGFLIDYGDAPDNQLGGLPATNATTPPDYQTREEDSGASHELDEDCPITIGDTVDEDDGTQQNPDATADDADEDGIFIFGTNTSLNDADIDLITSTYSVEAEVNLSPQAATEVASTVTGTVYNDYDSDGNFDGTQTITFDDGSTTSSTEGGLENVTVTAYDNDGTVVGSDITDANGEYSINNPNGDALRIEFTNLPAGYNNTSDTNAFVDGSSSTVNLGMLRDNHYVDSSSVPRLFTTCFVFGGYDQSGESALVSVLHTDQGETPVGKQTEVTLNEVGTVYGLAHSKQTQDIFLGAFQRRNTDVGPDGNDAIYRVDDNGNVNTLVELDTYFGTTDLAGEYAHGDGNDENNRPTTTAEWRADKDSFAAATKVGFGDVEITGNGEHIWTINLANRQLYKIEVGDGSTYTAQGSETRTIENFDIVNNLTGLELATGTTRNDVADIIQDLRPFALAERDGLMYVGLVDSAQATQDDTDLHAYVYSFDPTATSPTFTKELDFSLDYARQRKFFVHNNSNWSPWVDNFSDLAIDEANSGSGWARDTQPILSDIEFDNNGDIILGFRDRTADQVGSEGLDTDGNRYNGSQGLKRYEVASGGDILRGTWDSNTNAWAIESGATDTDPDSEFYSGEAFNSHDETAQGGVVQIPGYDSVETTALDPLELVSGGLIGLDNSDGTQTRGIELFDRNSGNAANGKANGLGDLEYAGELAPIAIGNRLWIDLDKDGIQDAGETDIADATVNLYDSTGNNLIASTVSNDQGEYYFNSDNVLDGLDPNTNYKIRLDHAADFAAGGVLENLEITTDNVNGNANDTNDSDGILENIGGNNRPTINVTTGNYGQNDYTHDFGFTKNITLVGWIDFDRSGTFEDTEAVVLDTSQGLNTDGTANTLEFTVPSGSPEGPTAARFRVASGLAGDNINDDTPNTAAPDGEVEDYVVNLVASKNIVNGTNASEVIDTNVVDGTTDGDDFINAGSGQDTLTGGDGIDCYHYDITSDGVDIITDFNVNEDQLDFRDIFNNELSSLTIPSNSNPFTEGYVEAITFGTGVMIQVDVDFSDSGDDPLNKDIVLLRNTDVNDIDSTDFIF